jgi:hypothetical protein
MFRIVLASVLLAFLTVPLLASPPDPQVFKGRIKDILGTDGTLTLTLEEGKQLTDRSFLIKEARIVGPDRAEMKLDDLRKGDSVEVEMAPGGKLVQEIRVVPDKKKK